MTRATTYVIPYYECLLLGAALASALAIATPSHGACTSDAQETAIELKLRAAREACVRRTDRLRDPDTFAACEAKALATYGSSLAKTGCDDGGGSGTEVLKRPRGTIGTALVELGDRQREVTYEVVDGVAIVEGDIQLGTVEEVIAKDHALRSRFGVRSGTQHGGSFGWSNNVIPFEISDDFSSVMKDRINSAIDHWNTHTIVRLRARDGESDYVRFIPKSNVCDSKVGKQGGKQNIRLDDGACSRGNVIHEIGHAAGLFHEQTRNDRDDHIDVHLSHVAEDDEHNFEKYGWDGVDRNGFDFNSIMLYSSFDFSDDGEAVMTKLDGSTFTAQRTALSTGDIAGVTMLITNHEGLFTLKSKLRNKLADKCMAVDNGSRSSGAKIEIRGCTGSTRQRWYFYRHPRTGREMLINERSALCVDVPGGSHANGKDLQQFPCHGGKNQTFTRDRFWPTDPWVITNDESGKCVSLESTGSGGDVHQATCSGSDRQKWFEELF
ncbi:MAG TPA: M12 family metallopeptidase [Candidatus Eisenbacteria bacterium]|nr:M12 family metallopeptidase [Candidatus Eisenbacteria bacterium]